MEQNTNLEQNNMDFSGQQNLPPQQKGKSGLIISILVILILITAGIFFLISSGILNFGNSKDISDYNGRWEGSSVVTVVGDGTCVSADAVVDINDGILDGTSSSSEYGVVVGLSGSVDVDGNISAGYVDPSIRTTSSVFSGKIEGNVASGTWESVVNGCSGTWTLRKVNTNSFDTTSNVDYPTQRNVSGNVPVSNSAQPSQNQPNASQYNGRWVGSSVVTVVGDGTCVNTNGTFDLKDGVMKGTVTSPEYGVTTEAQGSVDAQGNIESGLVESTDTTSGSYWRGKIEGNVASGTWESVVNGCSGTWRLVRQ